MADRWKEVREGFDRWLKLVGYCGAAWIFLDIIKYLPPEIVDRLIEAILKKLGI